jgi:CTP synthase
MVIAGWSADKSLVEMIELPEHAWFVACQFHPEFTSRPRGGHPAVHQLYPGGLPARGGQPTHARRRGDG